MGLVTGRLWMAARMGHRQAALELEGPRRWWVFSGDLHGFTMEH